MENHDIEGAIEGILFVSGDPVGIPRLSAVLGVSEEAVEEAAAGLRDKYSFGRRGIRLVRLDDTFQLCSAPEYADIIRLALETRKTPKLSATALEVLAVVAYFQPVTKAYVEQIRGVDSAYTIGLLSERGLIESCGRLAVPGRPLLYKTTPVFLRTFGIQSLKELPELPKIEGEEKLSLQNAIVELRKKSGESGTDSSGVNGADGGEESGDG